MLQEWYVPSYMILYVSSSAQETQLLLPLKTSQIGMPVVHPHVALNIYPEDTDLTISVIGQVMFEPCWNIRPGN